MGSRCFDIAVFFIAFGMLRKKGFQSLFLSIYNQGNMQKISKKEIKEYIKNAQAYYALFRLDKGNIKRAKELL